MFQQGQIFRIGCEGKETSLWRLKGQAEDLGTTLSENSVQQVRDWTRVFDVLALCQANSEWPPACTSQPRPNNLVQCLQCPAVRSMPLGDRDSKARPQPSARERNGPPATRDLRSIQGRLHKTGLWGSGDGVLEDEIPEFGGETTRGTPPSSIMTECVLDVHKLCVDARGARECHLPRKRCD
ncbi:unnamed protein product [Mycena citricolor]|uniref:Uncharacterized protein n=1 Tax=Mycena citricolor TaxID=2018698 RepID=A0AAD2HT88_9AGAR|nr:unnamed protein product [Mycena citricolor]